ncbi:hypothetical protein GCM10022223_32320 [Kineosporia mesophila]|uniref:LysM domain-containing protein n=1 Tax=Kineosporia mesophila TaxID=566012 RepID=A0ABP6ZMQ1_9ACTN|nr:LysM peptidoglycan-binding domain-containing protein [Kineosporia mesophila]MCD5354442.1 LysM peptidoglycan-binding domain-containing protein [Kineosporia mesophila]
MMRAPQRLRALVLAAAAAVALVVLLLGPPVVLYLAAGAPWETVQRCLQAAYTAEVTSALLHLMVLAGWCCWIRLLGRAVQAIGAVRRIRRQQGSLTPSLAQTAHQRTMLPSRAGGLIGGLLLAFLAVPASASTHLPSTHATATDSKSIADHGRTTVLAEPERIAAAVTKAPPLSSVQGKGGHREVRVQPSGPTSTLWGLAEEYLGDGTRWREIWTLNAGRQQADGTVMHSPNMLIPGWTVLVPTSSPVPAADASAGENDEATLRYTVVAGDRLGDISARFLGDLDYQPIQRANHATVTDPDHIETGDTLTLPAGAHDRGTTRHAHGSTHSLRGKRQGPPEPTSADPDRGTPTTAPRRPPTPKDSSPTPSATAPTGPTSTLQPQNARPGPTGETSAPDNHTTSPGQDNPAWIVPSALSALIALVALHLRRRSRRRSRHSDTAMHAQPAAHDAGEDLLPHEQPQLSEAALQDGLSSPQKGPFEHTDAAVDRARALIHRTAQDINERTTACHQGPTAPAELTAPERPSTPARTNRHRPERTAQPHPSAVALRPEHRPDPVPSTRENFRPPDTQPALATSAPAVATTSRGRHTAPPTTTPASPGRHAPTDPWADPRPADPLVNDHDIEPNAGHRHVHPAANSEKINSTATTFTTDTPQKPNPALRVRVTLFADPAVWDLNGNRVHGLRRNALQVLLYLALHPDGAQLNALRELIWPDITMSKAVKRLSTEVANLRRTIRTATGNPENLDINAVINTGSHYKLAPFIDVDTHAFEQALTTIQNANTPSTRETALRQGLALHTGRLADRSSLDYPWLQPHRRRLLRAGAKVRIALAEIVHDEDPDEAAALLHEAAQLDTTDRAIHERVSSIRAQITA